MSRHDYKQKNVSLLWHNNKHNSVRSNASTKLAWHGSHNGAWLAGFGLQAARFTHLVQMIKAFGQSKFCQQHVVNVSENTATIVSSSRGLKVKLLRGPNEDFESNHTAALWLPESHIMTLTQQRSHFNLTRNSFTYYFLRKVSWVIRK